MTRLDLGMMNKDYVDPEQLESTLDLSLHSPLTSDRQTKAQLNTSITLDVISNMVKAHEKTRIKFILRNNQLSIDHAARTKLWPLLCCATTDEIYDETFQIYASKFANVAAEKILPIDDMTEEMRVHHMLSREGVKACHRVLYVISETHPHIQQFSPLLYAFTSVMLHYSSEQACFRCIYELLRKKDVNYFLAPTALQLRAACFVLRDLAYRYVKSAASFIERHCPEEDFISFLNDWVLWIFKHLPFHYLVRIVDCYLVEGFKVLFRVALVLIKLFYKVSGHNSEYFSAGKPDAGMKSMCAEIHNYVSCDRLLKDAFGIRGFSKKEIDALFHKTELVLRAGGRALMTPRHTAPVQNTDYRLPRPSSRGSRLSQMQAEERNKRLLTLKSKLSFVLDKNVHTQLLLDEIDSEILGKFEQLTVWGWLPPAVSVMDPKLIFTTNEHGYSLKTFYEKVEKCGPVLIVIKTIENDVFGAYCATDWVERHKQVDAGAQISYFGCGQSFVFRINPMVLYNWVGKEHPVTLSSASMFQAGDKNILMVGGGGPGVALQMDKDLDYGRTERCDTFDNEPLCDDVEFRVQSLEAFIFTS